MTAAMVAAAAVALLALLKPCIDRPTRTIVPVYAASLPVASVVELNVPLPPPFNTLSSVFGAVLLMAVAIHVVLYSDARVPHPPVALWCLFMGWVTFTAFWAPDSGDAINGLKIAFPLVLVMVAFSLLRWDSIDVDFLRLALIASGAIVGLYALALLLGGFELPTHGVSQRFSVATDPEDTDPNILAASLLLPLALSLELLVGPPLRWASARVSRVVGFAATFLILVAIVATGSRGGLLSSSIVIVVTLYFIGRLLGPGPILRRVAFGSLAFAAAAAFALMVLSLLSAPGTVQRVLFSDPIERLTRPDSSGRGDIWRAGYLACETYCGTGIGIGNFATAYNTTFPFTGTSGNIGLNRPAHNTYLQIAVETGIIGLTLLLAAVASEWVSLSRIRQRARAPSLRGALVGLLVAEFFLTAIWFKFFWLVIAVCRAVEEEHDEQETLSPESSAADSPAA